MNEILNIQLNIQLNSLGVDEIEISNRFHVQHFLKGFLTVGTSLCFKASWKGKVEIVKICGDIWKLENTGLPDTKWTI